MRRRAVALALVGLVGAVAVAGCTRSGGGGASGGAVARPAAGYDSAGSAAGSGGGSGGGTADGKGAEPLALASPRDLIRTAELSVRVARAADVASAADRAGGIAERAGGAVYGDDRTGGGQPSARLTLKVPPQALERTLTALAALGTEQSRQVSTRDVTQQVADVDSRVRSAQDAVAALRILFDRATKLADVITIEEELHQREGDLESIQAQQRALATQTSFATVTLTLLAPQPGGGGTHHRDGFLGGLAAGWDNFRGTAGWLATALGAVLPFAVLLAAVGVVVLLLRRHRPSGAPAPDPAA